ncbi:MAG: hypothetical protein ACE366_15660 [Bradymonadia bacterium]
MQAQNDHIDPTDDLTMLCTRYHRELGRSLLGDVLRHAPASIIPTLISHFWPGVSLVERLDVLWWFGDDGDQAKAEIEALSLQARQVARRDPELAPRVARLPPDVQRTLRDLLWY